MKFDKYAKGYDAGWRGTKSARFYDDLINELDIQPNDAVLDVGCGTGTVIHFIASNTPIRGFGLDVSAEMLEVARKKNPDFDFRLGDSKKLPYADSSMDVIMACMAYHHFADQKSFREEARRVLKSNGRLYICDPRFPWIVRTFFNTCFKDAGFHRKRVSGGKNRKRPVRPGCGAAAEPINTERFFISAGHIGSRRVGRCLR